MQGGLITGQVSTNVLDNDGNQITGFGQITNLTLQNETNGLIEALGGTLVLNTTQTILNESGGTLEASSTGTLEIHDSVTNTGTGQLKTNAGLIDFKGGSSTTIVVNNTSTTNGILIGANGTLNVDVGTLELTGAGAVTLSSVSALITGQSAANILDNDGNQISGFGQITNLTLQNEAGGTIDANVSGQTLTLQTGNLIQNESLGVLEATLGGKLVIKDNVTNDGQLKALGGTIDVQAGGTITNNTATTGIVIDSTGVLQFEVATLELLGAGGVQIAGGTIQGTGANVLDNDGNTIAGFGLITGLTLENGDGSVSVVNANVSGQTLTLQTGNTIHNESLGVLEATGGGTLAIKDNVQNDSGGQLKAIGGTIDVQAGGTIQNDTLTTGIVVQTTTGPSAHAGVLQFEVPTLELLGAGGIQLIGGTIQGTGANVLDNDGNTIAGYGLIKSLTLENGDTVSSTINANVNGLTLTLHTGNTIHNESLGLLEATAGGTLEIDDNVLNAGHLPHLAGPSRWWVA